MTDGKLLVITPVDPAFLLIPILQTTQTVNPISLHRLFLSHGSIQQDGTLGTFRPADDIFEEASRRFQPSEQSSRTDSFVLSNDILRFASMKVVKDSLKRICDVKGNVSFLLWSQMFS